MFTTKFVSAKTTAGLCSQGGINERDEVVGSFLDASYHSHGFYYHDGHVTVVDATGGSDTFLVSINKSGVAVVGGFLSASSGQYATFTYNVATGAQAVVVQSPRRSATPEFIANSGEIVGNIGNYVGERKRVFVVRHGHVEQFSVKAHPTYAVAVNKSGVIAGKYKAGYYYYGFIRSHGEIETIRVPNSTDTLISSLSDDGTVFGSYYASYDDSGFTYAAGTIRDTATPKAAVAHP